MELTDNGFYKTPRIIKGPDFMTRIKMPRTQKFVYNPVSNSWSLDDTTEEITDLETCEKRYLLDHVKAMRID